MVQVSRLRQTSAAWILYDHPFARRKSHSLSRTTGFCNKHYCIEVTDIRRSVSYFKSVTYLDHRGFALLSLIHPSHKNNSQSSLGRLAVFLDERIESWSQTKTIALGTPRRSRVFYSKILFILEFIKSYLLVSKEISIPSIS